MIISLDGIPYSGCIALVRTLQPNYAPNPCVFGTLQWFVHALLVYHRATQAHSTDAPVYVDVNPEYHLALAGYLHAQGRLCDKDIDAYRKLHALLAPVRPTVAVRVQADTHHILNRIISYYHSYSGRSAIPGYYHSARHVDALVAFTADAPGFTHTLHTTPYFEFNLPESVSIRRQLAALCGLE